LTELAGGCQAARQLEHGTYDNNNSSNVSNNITKNSNYNDNNNNNNNNDLNNNQNNLIIWGSAFCQQDCSVVRVIWLDEVVGQASRQVKGVG